MSIPSNKKKNVQCTASLLGRAAMAAAPPITPPAPLAAVEAWTPVSKRSPRHDKDPVQGSQGRGGRGSQGRGSQGRGGRGPQGRGPK